MAMIECSKCSRHVSDGSPYCPHCGAPVPRKLAPFETDPSALRLRKLQTVRKFAFLVAVVGIVYGFFSFTLGEGEPSGLVAGMTVTAFFLWAVAALLEKRMSRK